MAETEAPDVSVVVTVFNEDGSLEELYRRTVAALDSRPFGEVGGEKLRLVAHDAHLRLQPRPAVVPHLAAQNRLTRLPHEGRL